MSKISIVKCTVYHGKEFAESFSKSIELLGGAGKFIKKGERILIKPNLLSAHKPEEAVATHPEFVRAAVRLVRDAGATPLIGDSPSTLNYVEVLEKTGIAKVAAEEKVEILNFLQYPTVSINGIHITKYAFDVDGIINLPKLKTHTLCIMTLAVKNLFGLVPGLVKTDYHLHHRTTRDFSGVLAEVYEQVRGKLRLSIIDGITGMDGEGPANGRVREIGLIMAGADAVALDTAAYELFGINPSKIPLQKICSEKNLGETDTRGITIALPDKEFPLLDKKSLAPLLVKDPKLPKTHLVNYIPEFAGKMLSHFVWIKPRISDECRLCGKCTEICPAKAIEEFTRGGKKYLKVNRKKCISCFCCNEVCPHGTIVIEESLPLRAARKALNILN